MFLDNKGINIARGVERKIENIFVTGEFRRVNVEKIKGTNVLENYNYFYMQNLINTLNDAYEAKYAGHRQKGLPRGSFA